MPPARPAPPPAERPKPKLLKGRHVEDEPGPKAASLRGRYGRASFQYDWLPSEHFRLCLNQQDV